MSDGTNTVSPVEIATINAAVTQTRDDIHNIREDVRGMNVRFEKMIELQIDSVHKGQAIERAFQLIKDVQAETERRWNELQTWRDNFENERGKTIAALSSTLATWKGGIKVLWAISVVSWGLVGLGGKYYLDNASRERTELANNTSKERAEFIQKIEINTARLRNAELYLAKDQNYKPAP